VTLTDSLQCAVPADWSLNFSQCLFEWQALEGGILALFAAGLSILFLKRQIEQSDRHEHDRLKRQHNATRATLPLTLSGLGNTLREMILALHAAAHSITKPGLPDNFHPPATPTEHISELQAVVASTDDASVTEPIAQIIREVQTLWSRIEMLRDRSQTRRQAGLASNIDEWIVQAAKIHALVESLFDFARQEAKSGPEAVGWDRAESIIFQLAVESESLKTIIQRGTEKSPSFWVLRER
jgi:hypothetical protein